MLATSLPNIHLLSKLLKKRAIHSKSDLWIFDGFQTKPLWKLEILQKLLVVEVFFA